MGLAVDTADRRADLVDRVCSDASVRFLNEWVVRQGSKANVLIPRGTTGEGLAESLQYIAQAAELFTVTPEMLDLIEHASKSLPPQVLDRFDLPAPVGWLHLPRDLIFTDGKGISVPIRDFMWAESRVSREMALSAKLSKSASGVIFWGFMDLDQLVRSNQILHSVNYAPEGQKNLRQLPKSIFCQFLPTAFGAAAWFPTSRLGSESVMASMHDGDVVDTFDDGSFLIKTMSGALITARPDPTVQFLKTYFHFVQSELTSKDRTPLPRSQQKMLRRFKLPTGPVTVIQLRKHHASHGDGQSWALTYRYVRRGFWRKQWYGSGENRYQKHIWIAPTIVGPDDGPLRVRDVVNIVKR